MDDFLQLSVSRAFATRLATAKKTRASSTASAGLLIIAGLLLGLPACVTRNPVPTVLYCTNPCKENHKKVGISSSVMAEQINSPYFRRHTLILATQPSDYPHAGTTGLVGFAFLLSAAGIFSHQTKTERAAIPIVLTQAKKEAEISALAAESEVALAQTQLEAESAMLTGQGAMYVLSSLAGATQQALGEGVRQQIEIDQLNHQTQLDRLELERAETQLKIAEAKGKVKKLESPRDTPEKPLDTLTDALRTWEDGWLWRLLNDMRPLVLTGDQGSGKTSTAAVICLIRQQLGAEISWLCDHHYYGANQKAWGVLAPTKVAATDGEIGAALTEIVAWWAQRIAQDTKDTKQVLVDEFTHLVKTVGEPAEVFIQKLLTDTRKARCQLTLITHTLTNSSFGNGTHETRKNGTICLRRYSADGRTPLPRVVTLWGEKATNGDALENTEHTLPSWFRPEVIKSHLNGHKLINFGG